MFQVSKEEKYALSILSQTSIKPNMISFIMNNCQDHRKYISMGESMETNFCIPYDVTLKTTLLGAITIISLAVTYLENTP